MMQPLSFPKTELKLTKRSGKIYVWDIFRKKELILTPEEWVRQHILHFMVKNKNVPIGLIASEYSLNIHQLQRRCDGVVFDAHGNPIALIECKAPGVQLTENVFYQIAQYNFKLQVNWLIMTNGLQTIVAKIDQNKKEMIFKEEIPDYAALVLG